MMGQAKIQTTVTQSKTRLVVDDNSVFNGQPDDAAHGLRPYRQTSHEHLDDGRTGDHS